MSPLMWMAFGGFTVLVVLGLMFSVSTPKRAADTERLDFVTDNNLVLMRGFGMWVVMHNGGNGPLLPVSLPHPTARAAIDAVMVDGIVPVALPNAA